ncbi:MAG: hypothetical protein ACRDHZ_11110, partial [Ktedonobacteraceae bacterium]
LDEHTLVGQNVQFRVNADIPGREWAYDITPLIDDTPISESWPPKDTKPIERVELPPVSASSPLLSSRLRGVKLKNIRVRKSA